jgi:hypothetical protein
MEESVEKEESEEKEEFMVVELSDTRQDIMKKDD